MKTLVACFSFLMAVTTANAAYLYWQVDTSAGDNTASSFYSAPGYNAARIGYYTTTEKSADTTVAALEKANKVTYVGGLYDASTAGSMGAPASFEVSSLTDASTYSYFIELVNYNSTAGTTTHVAYGEELSYADLVAKTYIDTGMSAMTPATWHGGSFNAVPEPTGALMVLFGLAVLGLKRQKA